MSLRKGVFIVFEGIDGSGKTTQANLLSKKIEAFLTKEPGDSSYLKNHIKAILKSKSLDPRSELLLMLADRLEHIKEVLEPNLAKGINVICDRYMPSSYAYQCYGRNIDKKSYSKIIESLEINLEPDLHVYLDLSVQMAIERTLDRKDKDTFEEEGFSFLKKVKEGYEEIISKDPLKWLIIDATKTKEEIAQLIYNCVRERFKEVI